MKTIIALTDFSSAAENAMHYAAQLCEKTGNELLLLHAYQIPVTLSDMPVILVSGEELKKTADDSLARAQEELRNNYPNISIKTESRIGDIVDELKEVAKEMNPFAVVLGKKEYSGFERAFFGSTAASITGDVKYPVISVPADYKRGSFREVVLAVDLENVDNATLDKTSTVLQSFHPALHVVYVTKEETTTTDPHDSLLALQALQPKFHHITNEDVAEGIQDFLQHTNADLLVVMPHQHSWFEKLFSTPHTKDILKKADIPVLSIPHE